ncbi:MAG: hypothetical protein H0X45_02565, partial [Planctomycetes bacterium]|nr:hypothetical protein [Planctomycetota bacterium]
AERCRQVVFWAVDWQAYEDFETAPSARWDARLFPADSRGKYVRFNALSNDGGGPPERQLAFWDSARTVLGTYGANPGAFGFANNNGVNAVRADSAVGQFGADRNGDGDLDRGPLPAALRLRASTIARFAFYDKRLFTSLRN